MHRLAIILALIPLAACTSQEDMTLLHREITDVQREVQQLQTSTLDKSDLSAMEKRMQELTSQTMRSNADLAFKVEQLQEQIEALHATLELTTRRLQSISQDLAGARAQISRPALLPPVTASPSTEAPGGGEPVGDEPASSAPTPSPGPGTSPNELYNSAYEDYMRGNYELAAQGFQDYLKRFSGTDLSDNALYWLGECYDALEQYQEALETFSRVLEHYPTSDKAAAAQLKKGLIYLKMGDQGQGVVHLQYVVYEHPGTNEAELARERLRSLGITIR